MKTWKWTLYSENEKNKWQIENIFSNQIEPKIHYLIPIIKCRLRFEQKSIYRCQ